MSRSRGISFYHKWLSSQTFSQMRQTSIEFLKMRIVSHLKSLSCHLRIAKFCIRTPRSWFHEPLYHFLLRYLKFLLIKWTNMGKGDSPVLRCDLAWGTPRASRYFGYNWWYQCKIILSTQSRMVQSCNILEIKLLATLSKAFSKSTNSKRPGICSVSV